MNSRRIVLTSVLLAAGFVIAGARGGAAQVVPKANWIWFDEGEPLKAAPAETVYFRKTFEEPYELADAEMHITCDNSFVLYINGKEIGRGGEWKEGKVFNVKDHFGRGKNVIAVKATNQGGPAGLVAWLVRLTKPGNHYTVLSDGTWKCSKEAGESWRELNFDDSKWTAAKVLGEFGKTGPWQAIAWNGKPDAGRFQVKDGFTVEQVAEHELTGSIVNMTFDWKGRPVISRERGSIFILEDENGDGIFDKASEYSDKVKNCQGMLCYNRETYYLVGDGPEGTGLYRLKDTDADDKADTVETLHKFKGGMGEHGPHAVVAGPDGYLYLNSGNHAWVTATPEPGSPVEPYFDLGHLQKDPNARPRRGQQQQGQPAADLDREVEVAGNKMPLRDLLLGYEADLLPKYEDANGHAVGIKVPGGSIWRLDPDAKQFTLEAAGFRNQYDFAFNPLGELFTFDSDMEWDEFLPWYRPVAVFHSPPGADHGWRSGSNVGPDYYIDNLPWTVATGRGSPCGLVFYDHSVFPCNYQNALFITDWSYGRIFALFLKRDGASFKAETEEFLTGKPLNVTDVEVAPDGSLFFTTGGRNTEGGVYRVRYQPPGLAASEPVPGDSQAEAAIRAALDQRQPLSAWGRNGIRQAQEQAGDEWGPMLESVAKDESKPHRQRLRAISNLMQFGPEPSLELARALTKTKHAEVRSHAAVLLARRPAAEVSKDLIALLGDDSPLVQRRALEGLIRLQIAAPLDTLKPLLASKDRFVRYTARLALQRIDPAKLYEAVALDKNPRVVISGVVAVNRIGLVATNPTVAENVLAKIQNLLQTKLPPQDELDLLRALELTLVNTAPASGGREPAGGDQPAADGTGRLTPAARQKLDAIGKTLLERFPATSHPHNRELSRLIAAMQVPGGIDKLLKEIEKIGTTDSLEQRADAIHFARCLMGVTDGWTREERQRFLAWFDVSRDWKGGHSYAGYITNFLRDTVKQLDEKELLAVVQNAAKFQRAATRAIAADERINDKADAAFLPALKALLAPSPLGGEGRGEGSSAKAPLVPQADVLLALGRTGRAEAEAILLKVYDQSSGELRDATVRALANFQNTRNWDIFVRALDSENKDTIRAALHALSGIEQKPEGANTAAAYRAAIQATARLGDPTTWDGVVLLRQWSGKHFGHKKNDWKAELGKWQKWYAETYPHAPSAKLAEAAKPTHNWTFDQLLAFLEGDGRKGSVKSGGKIFEKAVCAKCHKLEQVGTGLGPDLSTLASRFKRKDILEAIIYPSRMISDQYKSVLVASKDGRIITAMRAPDDGDNLVLLLSDAATLKLPKSEVEEIVDGKQSVMPDGLLNQFSLQEIADLFVFLESGRAVVPAANGQKQ